LSLFHSAIIVVAVSVVRLQQEVSQLSQAERLQVMELLWLSLSHEPQDMESPEWHGKVVAARQAKAESGKVEFLSVALVKERLRR
jgi:hypothetical protein